MARRRCWLAWAISLALAFAIGCDDECIDAPSNLTPEAVDRCVEARPDIASETQIYSASSQVRPDGVLLVTWSSMSIACGMPRGSLLVAPRVGDDGQVSPCSEGAWVYTLHVPAELAASGAVIDLDAHLEIRSEGVVFRGSSGSRFSWSHDPGRFRGTLELVAVDDACVSGILHDLRIAVDEPAFVGPTLDGAFMAPRCDVDRDAAGL